MVKDEAQMAEQDKATRKQLAEWLCATLQAHEASYSSLGVYVSSWQAATKEAGVPEEWQPIVSCLLTAGYSDVWDWCMAQGVALPEV